MTRIVDMHSHILPGLDDGAADIKESLQMLHTVLLCSLQHGFV